MPKVTQLANGAAEIHALEVTSELTISELPSVAG